MFQDILIVAAGFGSLCWISILLLPWRPWSTRENLEAHPENLNVDLSEVTVLTPARNEAEVIAQTMRGLNRQGKNLNIILIDDQSDDGTAEIARKASTQNLKIISGTELEEGWAGKLWALEQGRRHIKTPIILLLDADIDIAPGMIAALVQKMKSESLDLVSIMAKLEMHIFYEKLLIPSFIYFFKLLYPFALGNSPKSRLGVAAGGCILLKTRALEKIGGFEALRGALIDDCTLAQKVKSAGLRTWIGLSHSVTSHRGYKDLQGIWNMVARSAFTQLKYSTTLLVLCTLTMISMFWLPLYGLTIAESTGMKVLCAAGWFAMVLSYLPTLYFYRRSPLFTFTMPIVGTLYLAMTWTSAIRYFSGRRSEWKGRIYKKAAVFLVALNFINPNPLEATTTACSNTLTKLFLFPVHDDAKLRAERYAPTDDPILLLGESGVGKTEFAKFIHSLSPRKDKIFAHRNMSTISGDLAAAELFGRKKGAYTDATTDNPGIIKAANGGTLFLDEIGNLSLNVQAQLLNVLQDRIVQPIGSSSESHEVDVRFIAATNKDLHKEVVEGRFREDLYYRLAALPIKLPPLRDFGPDLHEMADLVLSAKAKELNLERRLSASSRAKILKYPWPGNIRELGNVLKRAAILSDESEIAPDKIELENVKNKEGNFIGTLSLNYDLNWKILLRVVIIKGLIEARGNRGDAADLAGINRSSHYNYAKQVGLSGDITATDRLRLPIWESLLPFDVTLPTDIALLNRKLQRHLVEEGEKVAKTKEELAEMLGIGRSTLHEWTKTLDIDIATFGIDRVQATASNVEIVLLGSAEDQTRETNGVAATGFLKDVETLRRYIITQSLIKTKGKLKDTQHLTGIHPERLSKWMKEYNYKQEDFIETTPENFPHVDANAFPFQLNGDLQYEKYLDQLEEIWIRRSLQDTSEITDPIERIKAAAKSFGCGHQVFRSLVGKYKIDIFDLEPASKQALSQ